MVDAGAVPWLVFVALLLHYGATVVLVLLPTPPPPASCLCRMGRCRTGWGRPELCQGKLTARGDSSRGSIGDSTCEH